MERCFACRLSIKDVVDFVHVHAELTALVIGSLERSSVFERVEVVTESLAVDAPGHKPPNHEIPRAVLTHLAIHVVRVDLIGIRLLADPSDHLADGAKKVVVAQIVAKLGPEHESSAE